MKYILDTAHISVLQHQRGIEFELLVSRLRTVPKGDRGMAIVSLHEQSRGAHAYVNKAKTLEEVVRGYKLFRQILQAFSFGNVVDFDEPAAREYSNLKALHLRIATMDLRIAAIAIANRSTLLTRNESDFANVPGLTTENWTA